MLSCNRVGSQIGAGSIGRLGRYRLCTRSQTTKTANYFFEAHRRHQLNQHDIAGPQIRDQRDDAERGQPGLDHFEHDHSRRDERE